MMYISFGTINANTIAKAIKPRHNRSYDIVPDNGYNTNQLCAQMVNIMRALNKWIGLWNPEFVKGMWGDEVSD